MICHKLSRQCISATVSHNNDPRGGKTHASLVSCSSFRGTSCHPLLSADAVGARWKSLPAFANLFGLYGRGHYTARTLGRRRDGRCASAPLSPVGHLGL